MFEFGFPYSKYSSSLCLAYWLVWQEKQPCHQWPRSNQTKRDEEGGKRKEVGRMSSVRREWNIWPPTTFLWEMGPGLPRRLLAFARSQGITDIIRTSAQKPQERRELRVSQNPQREGVDTTTPRLGANTLRNISWELCCRAKGVLSQISQASKIQTLKPMSTYTSSSLLLPEVLFQGALQQHQNPRVSRFSFLEHD